MEMFPSNFPKFQHFSPPEIATAATAAGRKLGTCNHFGPGLGFLGPDWNDILVFLKRIFGQMVKWKFGLNLEILETWTEFFGPFQLPIKKGIWNSACQCFVPKSSNWMMMAFCWPL